MNTIQIEYFIAVAKCLNFTKAAQITYTTQPNISKQIALMENELGFLLFHRTKQSVELTEAGRVLYQDIKHLSKQLNEAIKKAADASKNYEYKIKIGVSSYLDISILNEGIKRFQEKYKKSTVFIESVYFSTLRSNVIQGEYDIALSVDFAFSGVDDLNMVTVSKNNMVLAFSKMHPLAGKSGLTVADFKDDLLFVLEPGETPKGTELVLGICQKYGFTPKTKSCNSLASYIINLELGYGVAIFDSSLALPAKALESLVLLEIPPEVATTDVIAVWHPYNDNPSIPLLLKEMTGTFDAAD